MTNPLDLSFPQSLSSRRRGVGIQNTSPPSAVDYWCKIKILSDKPEIYSMKEIALKVKKHFLFYLTLNLCMII
jgi:hypothetical protein